MSGFGAPARTASPSPAMTNGVTVLATALPFLTISAIGWGLLVIKSPSPFLTRRSSADQRQRLELAAQHARGVGVAHPRLDHGRVDAAIVGRVLEVPVIEIREARHLAVLPASDRLANHEGRPGGTVIRALAGVFLY